eukprot:m.13919 g.13919  ORF g.13919 m.13919 type:complete len:691 (-) comp4727_c0_seq1:1721-3793(-)
MQGCALLRRFEGGRGVWSSFLAIDGVASTVVPLWTIFVVAHVLEQLGLKGVPEDKATAAGSPSARVAEEHAAAAASPAAAMPFGRLERPEFRLLHPLLVAHHKALVLASGLFLDLLPLEHAIGEPRLDGDHQLAVLEPRPGEQRHDDLLVPLGALVVTDQPRFGALEVDGNAHVELLDRRGGHVVPPGLQRVRHHLLKVLHKFLIVRVVLKLLVGTGEHEALVLSRLCSSGPLSRLFGRGLSLGSLPRRRCLVVVAALFRIAPVFHLLLLFRFSGLSRVIPGRRAACRCWRLRARPFGLCLGRHRRSCPLELGHGLRGLVAGVEELELWAEGLQGVVDRNLGVKRQRLGLGKKIELKVGQEGVERGPLRPALEEVSAAVENGAYELAAKVVGRGVKTTVREQQRVESGPNHIGVDQAVVEHLGEVPHRADSPLVVVKPRVLHPEVHFLEHSVDHSHPKPVVPGHQPREHRGELSDRPKVDQPDPDKALDRVLKELRVGPGELLELAERGLGGGEAGVVVDQVAKVLVQRWSHLPLLRRVLGRVTVQDGVVDERLLPFIVELPSFLLHDVEEKPCADVRVGCAEEETAGADKQRARHVNIVVLEGPKQLLEAVQRVFGWDHPEFGQLADEADVLGPSLGAVLNLLAHVEAKLPEEVPKEVFGNVRNTRVQDGDEPGIERQQIGPGLLHREE